MKYFERSKTRKSFRRNMSRPTYESPNRTPRLSRKSSFSRPAWMKKLGSSFDQPTKPIKVETPKTPVAPSPSQAVYIQTPEYTPSRMASSRKAKTLPASLNDTPNLEHIVQEFESGFMSPRTGSEPGTGNFVKKIVAAFEEKYKSYNDSWSDRVRGKLKSSGFHRHSYSNICQSLNFTSVEISQSSTETLSTEGSSTYGLGSGTPQINNQKWNYRKNESKEPNLSQDNHDSPKCENGTPFIIGAFLKKPIKVEETSINWIPFPGKKLPRKKSLKKLLSTLRGKRFSEKKKEVVFASQVNVSEETRELPDSGYDEKSVSSSSLASSTRSTPDLPQQDVIYENCRRSTNLTSFNLRSTNLSTFHVQHDAEDDESDTLSTTSKKLLLYEVSRDELNADLGPSYPAPSRIMIKSLDRKVTPKEKIVLNPLPKHPAKSTIPKHPFISLSKDELSQPDPEAENVQFRNTKDNFSSFHPSNSGYDVPRKFVSKSEPGIVEMLRFTFDKSLEDTTHYDVPKMRPKSSVYDDALSLKRRNADFGDSSLTPHEYYSSPCDENNQYATIRSRSRRYLSPEAFRSNNELRSNSVIVTVI